MDESLERKLDRLRKKVKGFDSVLIAYSGGVDSTLLLRICREELGENAVAVTVLSKDYPKDELSIAKRVAKVMGVSHVTAMLDDDSDEVLSRSRGTHQRLLSLARKMKLKNVLDGSHKDDKLLGSKSFYAARKAGVKSPLLDCGITKAEVRLLAKIFGLPNWNKTSSSKSRKSKSRQKPSLKKLEKARQFVVKTGARKASMMVDGRKLIISANRTDAMKIAKSMPSLKKKMKSIGFSDVLLSLSS